MAEITTTSKYVNYEIDLKDLELEVGNVQGVVMETKEGKKYGLEHLQNIWLTPSELAFAVAPFTENHGNVQSYVRYQDIPGQTISKITYLLKDADDIEIDTDLLCKLLAPENYSAKAHRFIIQSHRMTVSTVWVELYQEIKMLI